MLKEMVKDEESSGKNKIEITKMALNWTRIKWKKIVKHEPNPDSQFAIPVSVYVYDVSELGAPKGIKEVKKILYTQ